MTSEARLYAPSSRERHGQRRLHRSPRRRRRSAAPSSFITILPAPPTLPRASKIARRRAQPVKGAGDGSNKAQKNVVNKKKKSGKGDDSDDDEGSKAQKDLMKKKKEEEAAMRAKLGKKK